MMRLAIEKHFKSAVRGVWNMDPPRLDVCPDTYEGCVAKLSSIDEWIHNRIEKRDVATHRVIVVILESPHIHEFDENTNGRIGPASGNTGKRIRSYISDYFESKFDSCTLALVNVVQYQCSIGRLSTSMERYRKNKVVRAMFGCDVVKDCFMRMVGLFNIDKDVFLVACGKGNWFKDKSKNLDAQVVELLNRIGARNVIALGYHPSRWPRFSPENKVATKMKKERNRLGI